MLLQQVLAILAALVSAGLVGLAMPPLVAVVIRSSWPREAKSAVALASSVLVGTGTAWGAGELAGLAWPAAILVALAATELAYVKWWKKTGIAPWIERITQPRDSTIDGEVLESTTTPTKGSA